MFNGIIKNTGIVNKIIKNNNNCTFLIKTNMKFKPDEIGSSISCSGACLTLERYNKNLAQFYLTKETIKKTIFKSSKKGDLINLEKPLKFGDRISGHFVQGHVDTTCTIKNIDLVGKSWIIKFNLPKKYKKYIVIKGSIAVNGVSLTIGKILTNGFEIAIIPKTLKLTNLITLKKNEVVNIEFDFVGKYIMNIKRKKK
jgi:riboflavin synthase